MMRLLSLFAALLLVQLSMGFHLSSTRGIATFKPVVQSNTLMMACRRNNKIEKRKRNRDYARKFISSSKSSETRKKMVVEAKRLIVAKAEEDFTAKLFKETTDEDMPEYTGFDFV